MQIADPVKFLRDLFDAAVDAADPRTTLAPHLPRSPAGKTLLLGAGKAAASMAATVEDCWTGGLAGVAVTRYGHAALCAKIEVIEAGHPLPDEVGQSAAKRFLNLATDLTESDLLLFLISGGASALLVEPMPGLTLGEKREINDTLLKSGAPIGEINCLRKHLSAIKGGRLAAAAFPARVVTLAISDVPGDDPSVIGSGPTVGDTTSCIDALSVAHNYGIKLPDKAQNALRSGLWETVSPTAKVLKNTSFTTVATSTNSLNAAADVARSFGIQVMRMGDNIEGEASALGQSHADTAIQSGPGILISGGEATVTIRNQNGRGGPNCEYLLSLALALRGNPRVYALACDTDGIDGTEDAAGAVITPDTIKRAELQGLNASQMLQNNNSYEFFKVLGDLIHTGPTLTNVNDFRAILISGGDTGPTVL